MAELIDNPNIWTSQWDGSGPPPPEWNGSSYVFPDAEWATGISTASAQAGDTLTFDVSALVDGISNYDISYQDSQGNFQDLANGDIGTVAKRVSVTVPEITSFLSLMINNGDSCSPRTTITLAPVSAPPPPDCDELGRSTRFYVSGYNRERVHDARLIRGEKRCFITDFTGAIATSRTITRVIWRTFDPYIAVMSNARIVGNGKHAAMDLDAGWPGSAILKCEVELDNGERYAQLIHLRVSDMPWFVTGSTVTGPTELSASAS